MTSRHGSSPTISVDWVNTARLIFFVWFLTKGCCHRVCRRPHRRHWARRRRHRRRRRRHLVTPLRWRRPTRLNWPASPAWRPLPGIRRPSTSTSAGPSTHRRWKRWRGSPSRGWPSSSTEASPSCWTASNSTTSSIETGRCSGTYSISSAMAVYSFPTTLPTSNSSWKKPNTTTSSVS